MSQPLLSVKDLAVAFKVQSGWHHAVQNISYEVNPGEVLGIVGESGCGKSVSSLAVMGLLPQQAKIINGTIEINGINTKTLSKEQHRLLRAQKLGMIFQNPMSSLNPYLTVGTQMIEAAMMLENISKTDALKRALDLLERVHIAEAARRLNQYPHELSGGMCQRVMIAMILMTRPKLLFADEPTTALDVTVQGQILCLLSELMDDPRPGEDMAMVLISHDIGVIANMADRMLVMYSGLVMEEGETKQVLSAPKHPYTKGLFESIPDLTGPIAALPAISGAPPHHGNVHEQCPFVDRCAFAQQDCKIKVPELDQKNAHHYRCFHPLDKNTGESKYEHAST
jgi:oligopeptide transport system ATP-binding protein